MAQRIMPMLAYVDAAAAAEWLSRAFGFREVERFADARGVATDIVMEYDGEKLLVGHPSDAYRGPREHAKTCAEARAWLDNPYVTDGMHVEVDDLDAHYARAKAAGARILSEPEDAGFERHYRAEDPEGHRWMFGKSS